MMPASCRLREYRASDCQAVLDIFAANIREEWGTTKHYHDGKYLPNAERYVQSVLTDPTSDLNTVRETYLEPGGMFWVLDDDDDDDDDGGTVVGMVGLQVLPNNKEGELRRNCLLPAYRRKGWGTEMFRLVQEHARKIGLSRIVCSTPEHGRDDVLPFYGILGFTEIIFGSKRIPMHGTPIQEVFLEWHNVVVVPPSSSCEQ